MMAEIKKLTERELFTKIMGACSTDEDIVAFCEKKIGQLDKKNASSKKANVENEALKEIIVQVLAENKDTGLTATAVTKDARVSGFQLADENKEVTLNKVSALLTQLVKDGKVARIPNKKVAYFFPVA